MVSIYACSENISVGTVVNLEMSLQTLALIELGV